VETRVAGDRCITCLFCFVQRRLEIAEFDVSGGSVAVQSDEHFAVGRAEFGDVCHAREHRRNGVVEAAQRLVVIAFVVCRECRLRC
jgi:hypothetical protein